MYMRDKIDEITEMLEKLVSVLADKAEAHKATIMPGYTHLQRAQPITFGHHLMAYAMMFLRDIDRLADAKKRTNYCPIGSCALAGTTYDTDRVFEANKLGFENLCLNSMDGVSDRDFCVEFLACASLIMVHLSRFSEEIILWSSWEFKFIELDDAFTTGSSIMPQKKNPDMAELTRGKTGKMNHYEGGAGKKFHAEISVGNAVHTVEAEVFKAKLVRFENSVCIVSCARERARADGAIVCALFGVGKAFYIAKEHHCVCHKMVAECDGLSALKVCVAGHYGSLVRLRLICNDGNEIFEHFRYFVYFIAHIHTQVERNLVVAASCRVQLFAEVADALCEHFFHKHMDIFAAFVYFKRAAFDIREYFFKLCDNCVGFIFADDIFCAEHSRVRHRACYILTVHFFVEAYGRIEVVRRFIERF
jgi:hypothetical protein